jgi:hypothetical protein
MDPSTIAIERARCCEKQIADVLADLSGAVEALPKLERDAYREAQQSVVDARRKAEMREGLLWIN